MPPSLDRLQKSALLFTALAYSAGYATVGLALLLLIAIAEAVVMRRVPWRQSPLDAFLVAFVGVMLISAWVSPHRTVAVASVGLAALTIYLAYGSLQRSVARSPNFLDAFLTAWAVGGVATAVWAIAVYLATNQPAFTPAIGRNAVGTTLLVALIITIGLYIVSSGRVRWIGAAGIVVQAVGLGVTFTRGAWLGAVGALAALTLLERRKTWPALAIVLVVGVTGAVLAGSQREVFVSKIADVSRVEPNAGRIAIAHSAVNIFRDHPITGTGLNTFYLEYPQYQFTADVSPTQPFAHNIFLNMAAEGGLFGLAAFVLVILAALVVGWRRYAEAPSSRSRTITAAILSALIGLLIHQQFDGTAISVHLGLGMWLLIAALAFPSRGVR